DTPKNMFGKIMAIGDEVMWKYYSWLLYTSEDEIKQLQAGHPMVAKKELARRLTALLYDEQTAQNELEQFEKVFSKNDIPDDMLEFTWAQVSEGAGSARLVDILAASNLFPSKKEARRMIEQGA